MSKPIRVAMIGAGGIARYHIRTMLARSDNDIRVICEPSPQAYELASQEFIKAGHKLPPNEPDLEKLIKKYPVDTAFINTPHAYHHDQTKLCLESGLDVLLEKPMVMNAAEALSLIETRDRTGRLLVIAFQGGLSPQIRAAAQMLRSGELGELLSISGTVWQNWGSITTGTWRQQPEISGGGFLFDTGAHMLNTVCDLAGEDFAEVAAWFDNRGKPVDILGVVMGRLKSGGLVTINACGDTIPSCESELYVFCSQAIIRTGQWGERLLIQRHGKKRLQKVNLPPMRGAWEQFVAVRRGEIPNPCPPEVGLRMAKLWDAIRSSAAKNGKVIQVGK